MLEVVDEEVMERYTAREFAARMGHRVRSIWVDCLKDERRPIAKVQAAKTRMFTIPPVDYTMLARKYFLAFCAAFYSARMNFPSAVGIDCESIEWNFMFTELRRNSCYGFDGDFSCFDGTMAPEVMMAAIDIINNWYADDAECQTVREVLADEMIHTVQLCMNCMYITHRGNPSGNPLTVVINSMVNMMYMHIMWRVTCRESGLTQFIGARHFDKHVKFFVYGDDNILSVSLVALEFFNFLTVSRAFAQYGYIYTSAAKCEEDRPYRHLVELTFLKRGFRRHPVMNIVVPAMNIDTIYELTNWIRMCDDETEALFENLNDACRFAFFHGKEFFERFAEKVHRALEMAECPQMAIDYEDYFMEFMHKLDD